MSADEKACCYTHPADPGTEFVLYIHMSEKRIKEIRRKAARITGDPVDDGRVGRKAKKRAQRERERWTREAQARREARLAAERRHHERQVAEAVEVERRNRERELNGLSRIMTRVPRGR
ncbi:hypothetical protein [Streptomyces griseus]